MSKHLTREAIEDNITDENAWEVAKRCAYLAFGHVLPDFLEVRRHF